MTNKKIIPVNKKILTYNLFQPVEKNSTNKISVSTTKSIPLQNDFFLNMVIPEQLSIEEEGLLVTLIYMSKTKGKKIRLSSDNNTNRFFLEANNYQDFWSINLKTTVYEILKYMDMSRSEQAYTRLINSLVKLKNTICYVERNIKRRRASSFAHSLVNFNYTEKKHQLEIIIHPFFCQSIVSTAPYFKYFLEERKKIKSKAAKTLHFTLCKLIQFDKMHQFNLTNLQNTIYGEPSSNDATNRKRRQLVVKAIQEIGNLENWIVNFKNEAKEIIFEVMRKSSKIGRVNLNILND